jgi:hypothetical protein
MRRKFGQVMSLTGNFAHKKRAPTGARCFHRVPERRDYI